MRYLDLSIEVLGLGNEVLGILLCLLLGSHLLVQLAVVGTQVVYLELTLPPFQVCFDDLRAATQRTAGISTARAHPLFASCSRFFDARRSTPPSGGERPDSRCVPRENTHD